MGGLEERIEELEGRIRSNPDDLMSAIELAESLITLRDLDKALVLLEGVKGKSRGMQELKIKDLLAGLYMINGERELAKKLDEGTGVGKSDLSRKVNRLIARLDNAYCKYVNLSPSEVYKVAPGLLGFGFGLAGLFRGMNAVDSLLVGTGLWYLSRRVLDISDDLMRVFDRLGQLYFQGNAEASVYRGELPISSLFYSAGLVGLEKLLFDTSVIHPFVDLFIYDFAIGSNMRIEKKIKEVRDNLNQDSSLVRKLSYVPGMVGGSFCGFTTLWPFLQNQDPSMISKGLLYGLVNYFLINVAATGVLALVDPSTRKSVKHKFFRNRSIKKGDLEKAVEHQDEVIRYAGNHKTRLIGILEKAGLLLKLGRDTDAFACYKEAIEGLYIDGEDSSFGGLVHSGLDFGNVEMELRKLFGRFGLGRSVKEIKRTAGLSMVMGDHVTAGESFEKIAEDDEEKGYVFCLMASIEYEKARRLQEADKVIVKAAEGISRKLAKDELRALYGETVFVCGDPLLDKTFALKNDETDNLAREELVLKECRRILEGQHRFLVPQPLKILRMEDRDFIMVRYVKGEDFYSYLLRTWDLGALRDGAEFTAFLHKNLEYGERFQDVVEYTNGKLDRLKGISEDAKRRLRDLVVVLGSRYSDRTKYVYDIDSHGLNMIRTMNGALCRIDLGARNERVHWASDFAKYLFLGRHVLRDKDDYKVVEEVLKTYKKHVRFRASELELLGMAPFKAISYGGFASGIRGRTIELITEFERSAYRNAVTCLKILLKRYGNEFNLEDRKTMGVSINVFESLGN